MNKKIINSLVVVSYIKDKLDSKNVEKIAKLLSKHDLKIYLRGLKLAEKKHTVYLVMPNIKSYNKAAFEKVFKGKKLVAQEDKSLLLGLKIIDNDIVYDMNLKNNLQEFVTSVS